MNKALYFLITVAAVLLVWLGMTLQKQRPTPPPAPIQVLKADTVYIHDTTKILDPVPVFMEIEYYDTEYIAESPIIIKGDSLVVPIETKIYQTDEYRAVVQGYRAKLSELDIYGTSTQITQPVVLQSSKWGVGVTAGVAVTKTGWAPALTLGLTYNIYQPRKRP